MQSLNERRNKFKNHKTTRKNTRELKMKRKKLN